MRLTTLRVALAAVSALALLPAAVAAQEATTFTHADTLRGSIGPGRVWWDVSFYDLRVRLNPADSTVSGTSGITYRVLEPAKTMQLDLKEPLVVDSVVQDGRRLAVRRDSNAFFVTMAVRQPTGARKTVTVF